MKKLMITSALAFVLVGAATAANAQISLGLGTKTSTGATIDAGKTAGVNTGLGVHSATGVATDANDINPASGANVDTDVNADVRARTDSKGILRDTVPHTTGTVERTIGGATSTINSNASSRAGVTAGSAN